ncbi:MAG: thiamine diphosphokinase [Lactovum sp.]
MKVVIAAGFLKEISICQPYDYLVAVDYAAFLALNQGLRVDLAIGDFDSVSKEQWQKIKESGIEIERLKAEKDETDLELALSRALERYPQAEIKIIGSLGGRLDHELTNIYLPLTDKFLEYAEQICQENKQNLIYYLKAGNHHLKRIPDKKYIAFIKVKAENFSIKNAKYPLRAEDNFAEIYASNEFISKSMTISFDSGFVIVVYSSDK